MQMGGFHGVNGLFFIRLSYLADVYISARYGVYCKGGDAFQGELFHYVVAVGDDGG